jgi:hypothetical protein
MLSAAPSLFKLSVVCCLLSVVCSSCLLSSTFYCLLSTVYCLLSTVYCLLSTFYCLLSTVYCLLSTVYCLLSTVYCLLSTVYCLLSAVSGCCLLWKFTAATLERQQWLTFALAFANATHAPPVPVIQSNRTARPLKTWKRHVARDFSSSVWCTCPPLSAFVGFGPVFTRTICCQTSGLFCKKS